MTVAPVYAVGPVLAITNVYVTVDVSAVLVIVSCGIWIATLVEQAGSVPPAGQLLPGVAEVTVLVSPHTLRRLACPRRRARPSRNPRLAGPAPTRCERTRRRPCPPLTPARLAAWRVTAHIQDQPAPGPLTAPESTAIAHDDSSPVAWRWASRPQQGPA